MLINVVSVGMMEMAIMKIINMTIVFDGCVPAAWAMLVIVVWVYGTFRHNDCLLVYRLCSVVC